MSLSAGRDVRIATAAQAPRPLPGWLTTASSLSCPAHSQLVEVTNNLPAAAWQC
jgi:hypothetical protein